MKIKVSKIEGNQRERIPKKKQMLSFSMNWRYNNYLKLYYIFNTIYHKTTEERKKKVVRYSWMDGLHPQSQKQTHTHI